MTRTEESQQDDRPVKTPHDLAAERYVIGSALVDRSHACALLAMVEPGDLYDPKHTTIWRTIGQAVKDGLHPEPLTIVQHLTDSGDAVRVGGAAYLADCLRDAPIPQAAGRHAERIVQHAREREALLATARLNRDIAEANGDPERLAAAIAKGKATLEKVHQPKSSLASMMRSGGEFVLDVPEGVPAVWGDGEDVLWAEGEALIIAGPSGVGKTTITGQLLRALLGLSDSVLGWPVKPVSCVLYLAMDRPAQIRRALARRFIEDERMILDEQVVFWAGPPPRDIAQNPEVLLEMAEAAGAEVVIVDSLKDAAIGLSGDEVGAGYNRARQAVLATGRQILELHHVVKKGANGAAPNTLSDVYGSAHLVNGAGSVIMLWGAAGDPIVELKHLKQPRSDVGPLKILHNSLTGDSSIWEGADLLEVARRCGTTGLTASDAAVLLYETTSPEKVQVEKARRKLDQLTRQGLLIVKSGGRGSGNVTRWFPAAPASWAADGGCDVPV